VLVWFREVVIGLGDSLDGVFLTVLSASAVAVETGKKAPDRSTAPGLAAVLA
jgi:hypothetical protein